MNDVHDDGSSEELLLGDEDALLTQAPFDYNYNEVSKSESSSFDEFSDDDDDDDDDSSQDEHAAKTATTLTERRLANAERNRSRLNEISEGFQKLRGKDVETKKKAFKKKKRNDAKKYRKATILNVPAHRRFSSCHGHGEHDLHAGSTKAIQDLERQFPHRHRAIRLLYGTLNANAGRHSPRAFVPRPLFVAGPEGVGKTSVVRRVVQAVTRANSNAACAYADCEILEPSTIEGLLYNLQCQIMEPPSDTKRQIPADLHGVGRTGQVETSQNLTAETSLSNLERVEAIFPNSEAISTEHGENEGKYGETKQGSLHGAAPMEIDSINGESAKGTVSDGKLDTVGDEAETSRDANAADFNRIRTAGNETTQFGYVHFKASGPDAVNVFGRSLAPDFGQRGKCGFIVIDNADRLLSMKPPSSNYLVDLLLLPRVMNLNITIIVVSRNHLLFDTRLNASSLLTSVSKRLRPLRVFFPSYKTESEVTDIITMPRFIQSMVASSAESGGPFHTKLMASFVSHVIQQLLDKTTSIDHFVQLGRDLFPRFVAPLGPDELASTVILARRNFLSSSNERSFDDSILHVLRQKFFASNKAPAPIAAAPKAKHSALFYYTLLAAYICQCNKADHDKKVFSEQGNGKRKRGRKSKKVSIVVSTAIRPQPFLFERLLTSLVMLIKLNPLVPSFSSEVQLNSKTIGGSSRLYEVVTNLCDSGYLHQSRYTLGFSAREVFNLTSARFWCSLEMEEATSIASQWDISLDTYITDQS